tara:strand:- start:392 stop:535 length:144 start_codon:yes stop_codon:yes gene_type:complete
VTRLFHLSVEEAAALDRCWAAVAVASFLQAVAGRFSGAAHHSALGAV